MDEKRHLARDRLIESIAMVRGVLITPRAESRTPDGRVLRLVGIRTHGGNETMSELAFNANGESFEVPANVTGWRVRRMKPRGAPELVYGKDGRPLMIPIESAMEDLRDSVSQLGRYRLDPINEDGRTVEGVPAAYIQVVKPVTAESAPLADSRAEHDDPVREAMRLNTELARAVIDRFPEMMTAAAELLRAADGAGLPSRHPRVAAAGDDDVEDDDDDGVATPTGFDINAIVGQLVPVLMAALANGKIKLPGLGAMLDWRKALPEGTEPQQRKQSSAKSARSEKAATAPTAISSELPPIEPATMAHFIAVQAQLTPEESALAREVAQQLEPAELRQWFEELSKLSIPDAVAKIRTNIVDGGKTGGAS
jgi:hypothetical protein